MAIIDDLDLQASWGGADWPTRPEDHEPKLKRRLDGDTYVVVRHYSGLTEKVRRNLWALGLWSTGDAVTVDSTSLSRRGQIYVVREDVLLIPATAAAHAAWAELAWSRPLLSAPRPAKPHIELYEAAGRPAALITFENGEFARCETSAESFTLKWSSSLPPRAMLAAVATAFPGDTNVVTAYAAFTDDSETTGSLAVVSEMAADFAGELDVLRVRTGNVVFGWMANLVAHDSSKDVTLNQCAIVSRVALENFVALFNATATPALGFASDNVFSTLRDLTLPSVTR